MMRAVALILSFAILGCFPHDPRKRTYAQLVEGGSILTGVALEAVVNSGADCDLMQGGVTFSNESCHTKATILGNTGLALILGGLIGFLATISTAEEDKAQPPIDIKADKATNTEKPKLTLPPGVKGNAD